MKQYLISTTLLCALALGACAASDDDSPSDVQEPSDTKEAKETKESQTPKTPDCSDTSAPGSTVEAVQAFVDAYNQTDKDLQSCEVARLWADGGRLVSASRETHGAEDNGAHLDSLSQAKLRLTSGVTAHHGGTRFSWETEDDEGVALVLLDEDFRFTDLILFSGSPVAHKEVAPYDPYLAAWNLESADDRREELLKVWPGDAVYIDPTADVTGPDALLGVIDAYIRGFDGRAIVIDEVGQKMDDWFWVTWTIRDLENENDLVGGMDFCRLDDSGEKLDYLFSFFGDLPKVGEGGNEGDCLPCFPAKRQGAPPSALCTTGAPPSTEISGALGACVCSTACPAECGDSLCSGMPPNADCFECIETHGHLIEACPAEVNACWADG